MDRRSVVRPIRSAHARIRVDQMRLLRRDVRRRLTAVHARLHDRAELNRNKLKKANEQTGSI